jgi:hypothetical protein
MLYLHPEVKFMKDTALRIAGFKDSIFGVISRLARENNAVNLGQG